MLVAMVMLCPTLRGDAQEHDFGSETLIRMLSPDLRRMEQRLDELERELKLLPAVKEEPWGSRYGHRSADLPSETTEDWLQIDLGISRALDLIALMPVHLSYRREGQAGYGFPKRFRVEISEHPDMRDAVVVVDESKADVPNPGKYPLVYGFAPVSGRHVRITSLKHVGDQGAYFWAIEEMFLLEGNVLTGMGDGIRKSTSMDLFPLWSPVRAVDGQSTLGMPVDVMVPSPTHGYLSAKLAMKGITAPLPASLAKWCAVDLGKPEVIDQVRLLPLESDEYEVFGGRGFPRSFTLQFSNDPDFNELVWETRRGNYVLGYPGGCSVNVSVPGISARYVRVLVDNMWSRDDWYVFGLAELQVYGSNRNLSVGKRAYAKDESDKPPESGWGVDYLVDGYTGKFRLTEWPEYQARMAHRGQLEREKSDLEQRRAARLELGKKVLGGAGVMVAVLIAAGWAWLMVRHRLIRKREVELMRQQIARDLHDDIGSNLGGIVLLSEIGSQHSTDEDSRSDFETIRSAADDAAMSMRDIVWLIQRDSVGLKDFVTRMRQSLWMILKHHNISLTIEPEEYRDRPLGLLFRRHVFLSFKEVLNNVRKHARTDAVSVRIEIEAKLFRFIVRDEGIGFDPEAEAHSGCGMGNLQRRASRVSGSVRIHSASGKGTEVVFESPFAH
jgi:signal transduction histidine kinase